MRYKFIILFLILGFVSKAQVYQLMPQYGYSTYRMNFDSTIQIPTFCGVPKLGSNKINKGALAFDSCNNRFYFFNPKSQAWDTIKSGSTVDTTKFVRYTDSSAMLLPYLRKVDTTNKWVNSVTKLNDSTIQVIKGTTTSNITISSVTSATRLITQVWNNTGATILRGSVVYISGRHSSNLPTIALAEGNNEANSYKTFALVDGDIPDNSSGYVIQAGKILGLNLPTSSYTDGDILYLSPTVAGGYTTTKPLAPNHIVKLGSVTRAHPTQGSIEIKIENGWQLDELSDVQIASVPLDSTILQFSRVDSLWHDVNPTTAMGNRFIKPADTSAMLSPYIRTNTANASFVTSVFRKTASDSVFFVRGGSNVFAFRDSLGGGSISSANPTASVGLTAINGTANTFMRSDAAPALSQSISPTWTGQHTFDRSAISALNFLGLKSANSFGNQITFVNSDNTQQSTFFATGSTFSYGTYRANQANLIGRTGGVGLRVNNGSTSHITFYAGNADADFSTAQMQMFAPTGNILLQNGGSYTDAGFRLDVNGTTRLQGNATIPNIIGNTGITGNTTITGSPTVTGFTTFQDSIIITKSSGANDGLKMKSGANTYNAIRFLNSDNTTQGGIISIGSNSNYATYRNNQTTLIGGTGGVGLRTNNGSTAHITFYAGNSNVDYSTAQMQMFAPTGNVQFQDGGTYTDIASARVAINSTTQGFLQPRLTTTQMNAISTPATGLSVFNTTDSAVYVRRGTGAGWQQQAGQIFNTASLNFPSTNAQNNSDLTITLTGAVDGDAVVLGVPNAAVNANSCYTAWVSASNQITVRFNNYSSGAIDPAQATFKVTIIK